MIRERLEGVAVGAAAVAFAAGVVFTFQRWLDLSDATMVFLAAVLWTAVGYGRWAAVLTAVMAAVACNFFFFEPAFGFGIPLPHEAIRLGAFLLVAFTTGSLVARVGEEGAVARARSDELAVLYAISQEINAADDCADLIRRVEPLLSRRLRQTVRVGPSGTLEVEGSLPPARRKLLDAAAALVAVALERLQLRAEMEDARVLSSSERFRAALLSSVSHDFRTPLGSIMGAASTLLSAEADFSDEARHNLLSTILFSAGRLNRYVRNILDITTIQSGAVTPHVDWVELEDVIGSALGAVEDALADRVVVVSVPKGLPLLQLDFVLIERVFINLLENAVKFSPPGAMIEVAAERRGDRVEATVFNSGSDVGPDDLDRLFDKFYRGGSEVTGTGLGLAICRGFMAAHGGSILVERDQARGGIRFRLRFAAGAAAPAMMEGEDE